MVDEQIYNYVRQNLRAGYSRDSVKQALVAKGYDATIVDEVASKMNRAAAPNYYLAEAKHKSIISRMKHGKLLVEIIVLVVVLAFAGYVFFVGV